MDLIRIDDNKMKIMLTPVDMQCYELDADAMDADSRETRRAFRHILDDVRVRTGFDALSDKLYVQLYPSREGGCEMFVTRLSCAAGESAKRPSAGVGSTSLVPQNQEQRAPSGDRNRTVAFVFEALEHLLLACRRLRALSFPGDSGAWRGEEGRYYLILSEGVERSSRLPSLDRRALSFIHEYGTQQNAETVRLYIREHGCPICEKNAVMRLAEL